MRVVCSLFLSALLSIACTAYAQNDTCPYQIDKQATAQAPWKVEEIITEGQTYLDETGPLNIYRKFMGMTSQGYYVVQDFYLESHKKYSDPIAITLKDCAENIERSYQMDSFDGVKVVWYENGQKAINALFQNGKKQGRLTKWYDNGQKRVEGQFQNGHMQGLWVKWHKNGQKRAKGQFQNGKEQGLFIAWYENGQKESKEQYQNGAKQGLWVEWHENGQKKAKGQFQNGEEQGLWVYWDLDGKKISETMFEAGKVSEKKTFD